MSSFIDTSSTSRNNNNNNSGNNDTDIDNGNNSGNSNNSNNSGNGNGNNNSGSGNGNNNSGSGHEVISIQTFDLMKLSVDNIGLIISKLTIHDVSRLDIAYCNRERRQLLLNILCDNPFITYDHVNFDNTFKHIDNALIWIGLRKINISALTLEGEYNNRYLTDDGLVGLAQHCTGLHSLNISSCGKITDAGLTVIAQQCSGLQELIISGNYITDDGLIKIAQHCSSLTSLDIGD